MSTATGFQQYYDYLGLNNSSHLVHYDFNTNGITVPVVQRANTSFAGHWTGTINPPVNYNAIFGSGQFDRNNVVSISNASNLVSDNFTHFFIYQKTGLGRGTLFGSFSGTNGYNIGITDSNKLYFEAYGSNGPTVKVSSLMYGEKNAVAVVKTNNNVSFNVFDYNANELLTENFSIDSFNPNTSAGFLGGNPVSPKFSQTSGLNGWIDEYVYISESVNSSNLKILFSGFNSVFGDIAPVITQTGYWQITGFNYVFTGITGVTGYTYSCTPSGVDIFGDTVYYNNTIAQTGFLLSGYISVPLSGFINVSITGESVPSIIVDSNYGLDFGLSEVTYLRNINNQDTSFINVGVGMLGPVFNNNAVFDRVTSLFELNKSYNENDVQIYLNGISQIPTGYTVTGNFFGSGYVLSGDYFINGFFVNSTGFYQPTDTLIYDLDDGDKNRIFVSNPTIGNNFSIPSEPAENFVFLNGVLMISGRDYTPNNGSIQWNTNSWTNVSGAISSYEITVPSLSKTGIFPPVLPKFQRGLTRLFLNGQRQLLSYNYIENSSIDLLGGSGLFASNLTTIYNDEGTYFE